MDHHAEVRWTNENMRCHSVKVGEAELFCHPVCAYLHTHTCTVLPVSSHVSPSSPAARRPRTEPRCRRHRRRIVTVWRWWVGVCAIVVKEIPLETVYAIVVELCFRNARLFCRWRGWFITIVILVIAAVVIVGILSSILLLALPGPGPSPPLVEREDVDGKR